MENMSHLQDDCIQNLPMIATLFIWLFSMQIIMLFLCLIVKLLFEAVELSIVASYLITF